MKVHNILEEEVISAVNEMYEKLKEKGTSWLTCDCEQCRYDVTALVLNQLPPKYVVSGRGATYNTVTSNAQHSADIDTRVMDAIKIVSSVQRPYHNPKIVKNNNKIEGPVFNFPTFTGAIFDGTTFEPLTNATVTLKYNGKIAEMVDYTWTNPCKTDVHTNAVYSFWTKPVSSKKLNENKTFPFAIEVSAKGYESTTYAFNVPLVSEEKVSLALNSAYSLKLPDLFLFPPAKN